MTLGFRENCGLTGTHQHLFARRERPAQRDPFSSRRRAEEIRDHIHSHTRQDASSRSYDYWTNLPEKSAQPWRDGNAFVTSLLRNPRLSSPPKLRLSDAAIYRRRTRLMNCGATAE